MAARRRKAGGRPKGSRNSKLNPRVAKAIDIIEDKASRGEKVIISDVAEMVGMRRQSLSRALRRDDVQEKMAARVRAALGGPTLMRAAYRLSALIDANSEYVQLEASKHSLAVGGYRPKEQGASAGYPIVVNITLPSGVVARPLVDVTPQSAPLAQITGRTRQTIENE